MWLPHGTISQPIIKDHYFGDFQLFFDTVKFTNPYAELNKYNVFLPLGLLPFKILSIFSIRIAFAIYLFLSILLYLISIKIWFNDMEKSTSRIMIAILLFCNIPLLCAIDRGNSAIIAASLASIVIFGVFEKRPSLRNDLLIAITFSLLLSIKIYCIAILLLLILRKRLRLLYLTLLLFISLNLVLSYVFDNPLSILRQLEVSFSYMSGSHDVDMLRTGTGFNSLIINIQQSLGSYFPFKTAIGIFVANTWAISLLYIVIVVFLLRKFSSDRELVMLIVISIFQYLPPIAYQYTNIWAGIAAAGIGSRLAKNSRTINHRLYSVILASLFLHLIYLPAKFNFWIAGPMSWLFVLFTLMFTKVSSRAS